MIVSLPRLCLLACCRLRPAAGYGRTLQVFALSRSTIESAIIWFGDSYSQDLRRGLYLIPLEVAFAQSSNARSITVGGQRDSLDRVIMLLPKLTKASAALCQSAMHEW